MTESVLLRTWKQVKGLIAREMQKGIITFQKVQSNTPSEKAE